MEENIFRKLVEKHFMDLINNYRFSIIFVSGPRYFGDCYAVLESESCRIRIRMDRGVVEVFAGLKDAIYNQNVEEGWYDVYYVTRFLMQGKNQAKWEYIFPEPGYEENERVERQMKRLKVILKPYWKVIIEMFQEDGFKKRKKKMDIFVHKLFKKNFG